MRLLFVAFAVLVAAAPRAAGQLLGPEFADPPRGGIGLRFAGHFNRFFRAEAYPVIDPWFSNLHLALTYKAYSRTGHAELGLAYGHKSQEGGFNLPLVMQDFSDETNTGLSYLQFDVKAGPRLLWHVYPKFGFNFGWFFTQKGLMEAPALPSDPEPELNRFYVNLPVGLSVDLPTSFGTTGFGLYYIVGITNALRGLGVNEGSRWNGVLAEIHVLLRLQ